MNGISGDDLIDLGELLTIRLERILSQRTIVEEVLDNDLRTMRGHGARLYGFARVQAAIQIGSLEAALTCARLGHDSKT